MLFIFQSLLVNLEIADSPAQEKVATHSQLEDFSLFLPNLKNQQPREKCLELRMGCYLFEEKTYALREDFLAVETDSPLVLLQVTELIKQAGVQVPLALPW
ncbi:uncharacterized protein LOC100894837 isoform X2 [Callithrix jacchus]